MKELIFSISLNSINFKSGRFRRRHIGDYTITYSKYSIDSYIDTTISLRIVKL